MDKRKRLSQELVEKFQTIPESDFETRNRVLGTTFETEILITLLWNIGLSLSSVIDGRNPRYPQLTIKSRLLAALSDVQKMERRNLQ